MPNPIEIKFHRVLDKHDFAEASCVYVASFYPEDESFSFFWKVKHVAANIWACEFVSRFGPARELESTWGNPDEIQDYIKHGFPYHHADLDARVVVTGIDWNLNY